MYKKDIKISTKLSKVLINAFKKTAYLGIKVK